MVTEWLKKNWRLALRSVQKAEPNRSAVFTRCGTPLVYSGEVEIEPSLLQGTRPNGGQVMTAQE